MAKLKFGVIGCGWIGTGKHISTLSKHPNAELVALCDIVPAKMDEAEKSFGLTGIKKYQDYRDLCSNPAIDVIHICTPNVLHYEMTMAALQNGKHVHCEKPLATRSDHAIEMAETARKVGKRLTIGHQRRFFSSVQYMKNLVDEGELGEIYYAKALDARRRGVPTWGDYMRKERNGGGILFDGAPHSLDMTMYLMNNFKPVSVFGRVFDKMRAEVDGNPWGVWDPTQSNVEDTGFAMITMEGGAVVYLEAAWLINMIGYANSTLLVGTKAGVDMQGQNGNVRVNKIYNGKMVVMEPEIMPPMAALVGQFEVNDRNASSVEIDNWIQALLNDREPLIKGEEGIAVVQIIESIYKSSETGRAVTITPYL
ncbi:MAG: Gfo/Idh/MocA family protein [Saccharofermentanales bacterium]|jgi:predicted dehydrogenase